MDKLKAIQFFLKLSDTLSFKETATYFGVPSSTVSRSIKALEQRLGVSLLERTTRRIRLTESGEWYRNQVSGPIRSIAAADEIANAQSREHRGTVRITAVTGYGHMRLFPALERFRKQYPNIVCDVELSDRYLDLSTGEIDVAIRATATPPDYLVAKRLHDNEWILVASPEYIAQNGKPKLFSDIEKHQALGYRGARGVMPWLAYCHTGKIVTIPRQLSFVTNYGLEILNAAKSGEGLAFLPRWGLTEALADNSLQEITLEDARIDFSTGPEMNVYLLYDPNKAKLGKIRATVDFLRDALSEA